MVQTGDKLKDKYEILNKVASGGMGTVYKAYDHNLDRYVAVKFILADKLQQDPWRVDAFIEEARIIARAEHANILTVYDLDVQKNIPYIVMKLADKSVAERIKTAVYTPEELLPVLKDICEGLQFAHDQNILHLDLKPANILLTIDPNGTEKAYIADFGLARLISQGDSKTTLSWAGGTPSYSPPEQWQINEHVAGYSDTYALGHTIHHMLVGRSSQSLNTLNQNGIVIDVDTNLPPSIQAVIAKAVSLQPADRYPTPKALFEAYQRALDPTAVSQTTTTPILSPQPIPQSTITDKDVEALLLAMQDLGQHCDANQNNLNEREVVTYCFRPSGFFEALGYNQPGQDAGLEKGNADVILRAAGGRTIAVIEFKRPSRSPQQGLKQLEEDYVPLHQPDVGVLCNGRQLVIYRRNKNSLLKPHIVNVNLQGATKDDAYAVYQWLGKRQLDLANYEQYRRALKAYASNPVLVQNPSDAGGTAFLNRFSLTASTPFGQLVRSMAEVLPMLIKKSNFTRGAYNFWQKIYARDLKQKDTPNSWKAIMPIRGKQGLYQFMFALESAYALLSRLILARAMETQEFPFLNLQKRVFSSLEDGLVHGRLPNRAYAVAMRRLFENTGKQAFSALFASDIFDWWHDLETLSEDQPLGDQLAHILLAIFAFDFSQLKGDLLGSLYQSYFDPETRRTLGEFYTPPEIVSFILQEVGYTATNPTIKLRRLLDPACGSGTFLVEALQIYLQARENDSPTEVLRDLLSGLRIVGFDINPFAVLMAQVNYAAQIVPLYIKAIEESTSGDITQLTKLPIPIMRTDSLRQEYREGEQDEATGQALQLSWLNIVQEENVSIIQTELPVEVGKNQFFEAQIPVPRYDKAKTEGWVRNPEEYFTVLRTLFEAVDNREDDVEALRQRLQANGLTTHAFALAQFMQSAAKQLVDQLRLLREKYNDGRFLKTLADLALAIILKSDIQYDYVVGNPPYIRVQTIPEMIRQRWEGWYAWAEGSFDAYIPFFERALEVKNPEGVNQLAWLKTDGKLGYIVPNRFLHTNYAETFRKQLPKVADVDLLLDMRDAKVFTDALNYPAILILNRRAEEADPRPLFPALRVFQTPPSPEQLLADVLSNRQAIEHEIYAKGEYADAFWAESQQLQPQAWLFMPLNERTILQKIEQAATLLQNTDWPKGLRGQNKHPFPRVMRLEDLTRTSSGGFAGYQTSADDVCVLRVLEDRGDTLLLKPKGADDAGWNGPTEVLIEKAVLRRWLFGRDVERWYIAWDGWYVIYPYALITSIEQRGDAFIPVTRWRLIPTQATENKFDYKEDYLFLEEAYPHAWQYLTRPYIEERLRGRESNKFQQDTNASHLWYGAGRPQNLDYYPQEKTLIQVSSTQADIALDTKGEFVFTAGGTSGVYGLLPDTSQISQKLLVGLLNSRVLDFYLKHISTVYAGNSYSYGDQFIKQLPIKLPQTPADQQIVATIIKMVGELVTSTNSLNDSLKEVKAFPEPQLASNIETYAFRKVAKGTIKAKSLKVADVTFTPDSQGRVMMSFGKTKLELANKELADLVSAWLNVHGRTTLPTKWLSELRVPLNPSACSKAVKTLKDTQVDIATLQNKVHTSENELNKLILQYYGLDGSDEHIIKAFLADF